MTKPYPVSKAPASTPLFVLAKRGESIIRLLPVERAQLAVEHGFTLLEAPPGPTRVKRNRKISKIIRPPRHWSTDVEAAWRMSWGFALSEFTNFVYALGPGKFCLLTESLDNVCQSISR